MMRPDDQEKQQEEKQQEQNEVCERLRPELKAYVDGQAGWWQRQSIGRHLTKCADCREETAAMRAFSAKWRRADDEVLDPNLRARILAAVPDTPPVLTRVSAPSRLRPRSLALAGAGASAVIVAALLFPQWQRSARVGSEDAATMSLHSTSSVTSAASPATAHEAAQTMDGAAAKLADPTAPERNVAASAALPPKTKETQIADVRQYGMDKNGGANAADETSGAGGNGSVSPNAAGAGAAVPAPSSAAVSAKSAVLPTTAAPSLGGSANVPPASGTAAAANGTARDTSPTDNKANSDSKADKPSVNSTFDKSKSETYTAATKPAADANDHAKNALPQEAHETPQTDTAAMAHRAGHAMAPGGEVTPAKSRPTTPRFVPMPSPTSPVYGRAMTPANASDVLLKISVVHIEMSTASIERDIRAAGGSVVTSATQTDADGTKSATLLLKAPAASLNAFLAHAEQTGTTLLRNVPPVLPKAATAGAAKRRTNTPVPKEGRGQKAYRNVTIRLLNRKATP